MAITLPPTIARFIDASNARDLHAAVACFAADAVVEDEGRTHRGLDEVRAWKQETEDRFRYTIDPTAIDQREGLSVVSAILAGNFPGSPVELEYEFTLVGDAIESLTIHP
jgi:ketosteroid isomerase-like protein